MNPVRDKDLMIFHGNKNNYLSPRNPAHLKRNSLVSNGMKYMAIFIIRAYQKTLSLNSGIFFSWRGKPVCRFYPTCSEYAIRAIEKYGILRGVVMAVKRVARCTPKGGPEVDEP